MIHGDGFHTRTLGSWQGPRQDFCLSRALSLFFWLPLCSVIGFISCLWEFEPNFWNFQTSFPSSSLCSVLFHKWLLFICLLGRFVGWAFFRSDILVLTNSGTTTIMYIHFHYFFIFHLFVSQINLINLTWIHEDFKMLQNSLFHAVIYSLIK